MKILEKIEREQESCQLNPFEINTENNTHPLFRKERGIITEREAKQNVGSVTRHRIHNSTHL